MKKAAIIPVDTIGDALILMILANHLKKLNYDVTIIHDNIFSLKNWFSDYNFEKNSHSSNLNCFDHIFIQNDDSCLNKIKDLKDNLPNKEISIIYFSYKQSKHGNLSTKDIAISEDIPIAHALAKSLSIFFNTNSPSLETGITIPKELIYKKHPKRIVIHPTSKDKNKCYHKSRFIKLCKKLKRNGYEVAITVSSQERNDWSDLEKLGIFVPNLSTLSDFASYLYESSYLIGNDSFAVHLASLLNIDHILIAANKKLIKTWRPGWLKSNIILPSDLAFNIKFLRIREKYYQYFISVNRIYKTFALTHSFKDT
ncbi:MAG: glycosyltransferase family 9 protein [Parachlamydiales bacterium]|jgi:hypothetical protein